MYAESDLLPLSALQHFMFCERQCALIHLEQAWEENRLTAEGRVLHEKVHESGGEVRAGVRIARGVRIRSLALGLIGQADVVEFSRDRPPFPVEYKRGRPKPGPCDEVQLCAQALCLEEMMGIAVPEGAIFYGQPRRRHLVSFTQQLRDLTANTAKRLHELIAAGKTPPAEYDKKKCEACSLAEVCLPRTVKSARNYWHSEIASTQEEAHDP